MKEFIYVHEYCAVERRGFCYSYERFVKATRIETDLCAGWPMSFFCVHFDQVVVVEVCE